MNLASVVMMSGYGPYGDLSPMSTAESQTQTSREEQDVTRAIESALGKDTFLRLLTTQLRYQDPLNPIKDQDFIAQMAQFTALEQTQRVAEAIDRFIAEEQATHQMAWATSLLGRQVMYQTGNGVHSGIAEAIQMKDGVPMLVVGGALVRTDEVIEVVHIDW